MWLIEQTYELYDVELDEFYCIYNVYLRLIKDYFHTLRIPNLLY